LLAEARTISCNLTMVRTRQKSGLFGIGKQRNEVESTPPGNLRKPFSLGRSKSASSKTNVSNSFIKSRSTDSAGFSSTLATSPEIVRKSSYRKGKSRSRSRSRSSELEERRDSVEGLSEHSSSFEDVQGSTAIPKVTKREVEQLGESMAGQLQSNNLNGSHTDTSRMEADTIEQMDESRNDETDYYLTSFDSLHDRLCGTNSCLVDGSLSTSVPLEAANPKSAVAQEAASGAVSVIEQPDDPAVDEQSVSSVSTIGRYFSDLASLPSVQESTQDDQTMFSMGNLSALGNADVNLTPPSDSDLGFFQASKSSTNEILKSDSMKSDVPNLGSMKDLIEISEETDTEHSPEAPEEKALNSEIRRQNLCKELRDAMETYGRYDIRCANIAAALGDLFCETEENEQALQVYEEAVAIYSAKLGDHHLTTLDCKTRIAKMEEKHEKYDRAIRLYYDVISMRKALSGPKHLGVAEVLFLMSKALDKKGSVEQAIKEMKRSLKIYRETLSDTDPKVAACVDEIAQMYMKAGDVEKASAILEEVVKLRAATLGVNHEHVARSLIDLASAQESIGGHEKSLKALKKAFSIFCNLEDENSQNATQTLERIAMCYRSMGQGDKAITTLVGVLRSRKEVLGDRDRLVASTFMKMGTLLREEGHHQKALRCMKHSLSIYVAEGKDMKDVAKIAEVMHEMALIHQSKRALLDACKVLKQEVAIRQKMGKSELPQVVKTLNLLGMTELNLKNNKSALKHFMEALAICEKKPGLEMVFGETLLNTGLALKESGHKQRAKEAFIEAFKIFKKEGLSKDHKLVADIVKEMTRVGARCECDGVNCKEVPCRSLY